MRIVVTGATGNLGTSVLEALSAERRVREVIGLARRLPHLELPKVRFASVDVSSDSLASHFAGADAVVHLAWRFQPSRTESEIERTNVRGSNRVFSAAGRAGVRRLVHASSVAAYSRGPKDRKVDESWPVHGLLSSVYSRQKARVERLLDDIEPRFLNMDVIRLRPALVFKREAAAELHRLFLGRFLPRALFSRAAIQLVPEHPRLAFQAAHSGDVADACCRAVMLEGRVRGAFNLAADPVLDGRTLARAFKARAVRLPPWLIRAAAAASWQLRLQPAEPGWIDLAYQSPLMETERARTVLGWTPTRSSIETIEELLDGLRHGAGAGTAPLAAEKQARGDVGPPAGAGRHPEAAS